MKKRLAGVGLVAGLVAGTGAGFLLEMSGSAGAAGTLIEAAAADSGGDVATADPAGDHTTRLQEVLQPLVDSGTLTQAQVDAVIEALDAARPEGRPGDRGGMHRPGGMRGPKLDVVATTLGITVEEVRSAIGDGQTIAELAVSEGSTAQAVIDALVADVDAKLDEQVAAGELTQDEADAKLADATTRITAFVNETKAPGEGRPHGPGRPPADETPTPDDSGS